MFVLSALVFVAWRQLEPARAFEIALAVLVVSCPCALSLAIPTALAAAHSAWRASACWQCAAKRWRLLARVDSILLDKTGTLTLPTPGLASIHVFAPAQAEWVRSVVAGLQRDSRHPLASAFQFVDAKPAAMLDGVESVPGQGLRGYLDRRELRLGRGDFATGACDDGAVWLGDGHTPLARFELTQVPRGDAAETLARLRAQGLALEISSGDGEDAVREVARQFKVARWSARQSPALKLERLRALQQAGHCVAMLGDGINDAPVLAGADVSFALGEGAGLAHRAADFVLAGTSLRALPATLALARRTRRVTRQNLAWAVLYNAAALPFAALGWVPPWLAALGMALSSLLVTVNALRLLRVDA
jgi:Cu2+-exporting ATPase